MREHILRGQLKAGAPVPSSRRLADALGIARGTVVLAYDQLVSEGYLVSRYKSGTCVSTRIPDLAISPVATPRTRTPVPLPQVPGPVSPFSTERQLYAFAPHRCETRMLPVDVLRRLHSRLLRGANSALFEDGPPTGLRILREAVAAHLREARALTVEPSQVLVLGSMQQALDVAVRVLTQAGESVWMEDPGYAGAHRLLECSGRRIVYVPVDAEGLQVARGEDLDLGARMAYVTPSRQAPLGVPMSLSRRAHLLAWANRNNAWIFEDDYDSEYRFSSKPVPPLAADDGARVLLAGSFSKLLYPGLRLAYLVCPPGLVDAFAAMLSLTSRHPNLLAQAVMGAFIHEGHLARYVRKMRRVYLERAEAFCSAAQKYWRERLEVGVLHAGLDATVRVTAGLQDTDAATVLRAAGIECAPLSAYCVRAALPPALLMGFAAVTPSELDKAARVVARVLRGT